MPCSCRQASAWRSCSQDSANKAELLEHGALLKAELLSEVESALSPVMATTRDLDGLAKSARAKVESALRAAREASTAA